MDTGTAFPGTKVRVVTSGSVRLKETSILCRCMEARDVYLLGPQMKFDRHHILRRVKHKEEKSISRTKKTGRV